MLKVIELQNSLRGFGPVNLEFFGGQMVMLCGPSGSGKSSFCQLLCGELEPTRGQVLWEPETGVGYLSQDVEDQLLGATVEQELELGQRRALAAGDSRKSLAVEELRAGFDSSLGLDPHQLSKGEQQLLLLTSLALGRFRFFLVDEGLSMLDHRSFHMVCRALRALVEEGAGVVVVSHDPRVLLYSDRCLGFAQGRCAFDRDKEALTWSDLRAAKVWLGTLETTAVSFPEGSVLGGECSRESGWEAGLATPLAMKALAIAGPSGSGKSERLWKLAKGVQDPFLAPAEEGYRVLLRQHVRSLLWRRTVDEELTASLSQGQKREPAGRERSAAEIVEVPAAWRERSPRSLSFGQAKFLACMCLLLQEPDLILLDEPFTGLDSELRALLETKLDQFLSGEKKGRVIFTSHHPDELVLCSGRLVILGREPGQVEWSGESRGYFRTHPDSQLGQTFQQLWGQTSSMRA